MVLVRGLLHHSISAGVAYRDPKLNGQFDNMILTAAGHLKLLDFGRVPGKGLRTSGVGTWNLIGLLQVMEEVDGQGGGSAWVAGKLARYGD